MTFERLIKRTIYVAKCDKCEWEDIKEKDPPRDRLCRCGEWISYKEQSAIGPDLGQGGIRPSTAR